ncbi:MAG: hypothetical protein LIP11_08895 [Clostridiales bacterium]|nr:hypothetical protein [Clostridiales bacterium]
MKIQYLGTAAAEGWPAPFCRCEKCNAARVQKGKNIRSRSQMLVNNDLLIDFGPDTFYHSLLYGIQMDELRTVLLTHSHTDHFHPADLYLRAIPYAYGQSAEALHVFGNEKCETMYCAAALHHEAPDHFESFVRFHPAKAFQSFCSGDYEILPLKAIHDPRENCLLYAVKGSDQKTIFYGNDTGSVCEETWTAIKNWYFDLVSLDCTMGNQPSCATHLGLEDAALIREKMLENGNADSNTVFVITHFSHGCTPLHEEMSALGREKGFLTAYDGMELNL